MDRPTTRLLALLELLQTHRSLSGPDLAARLGVDVRTVRRYVGRLEELGIPITAERGRHGRYGLVAGYKLPPLLFTDDEALALSVGLLAARALGLDRASPGVSSAEAKIERVAPEPLRRRMRAAADTFALALPRATGARATLALARLSAAAGERRRMVLRYRSRDGQETERPFDPYALAYRGGCWYALGHCHLRGGRRSFRVDRIESVRALPETFERPPDFDALAELDRAVASLPRAHAIEVVIDAELDAVQGAVFAALGILEPVPEGVRLSAQADDLDWFAGELARLPFPFEIRRPDALRSALRTRAERLIAMAAG